MLSVWMEKPSPAHLEQVARGGGEVELGFELIVPSSSVAFLSFNSALEEVDLIVDTGCGSYRTIDPHWNKELGGVGEWPPELPS